MNPRSISNETEKEETVSRKITVEFFGVPRLRIGMEKVVVDSKNIDTLGELLERLRNQIPAFDEHCMSDGSLNKGVVCNFDGQQFVTDPQALFGVTQSVLILSTDAGG